MTVDQQDLQVKMQKVKPLVPFQWPKGVSGNPKGRKKGSKSLKEFAREYLLSLPNDEKLSFLRALPPEIAWKMAEGNPHNTEDVKVHGPTIAEILTQIGVKKNDSP